MNMIFM